MEAEAFIRFCGSAAYGRQFNFLKTAPIPNESKFAKKPLRQITAPQLLSI